MRSFAQLAQLVVALAALVQHPVALDAQYFGRNKVRGDKFDFRILEHDHVLGHELVHVFQYDIADTLSHIPGTKTQGLNTLPPRLIEGMAEYLSVGRVGYGTGVGGSVQAFFGDMLNDRLTGATLFAAAATSATSAVPGCTWARATA